MILLKFKKQELKIVEDLFVFQLQRTRSERERKILGKDKRRFREVISALEICLTTLRIKCVFLWVTIQFHAEN